MNHKSIIPAQKDKTPQGNRYTRQNLFENQTAYDRPDLVARVFNLKKKAFLKDLIQNGVFGKVVAHVHTVEFQKRGLPHLHILLILSKSDAPVCAA